MKTYQIAATLLAALTFAGAASAADLPLKAPMGAPAQTGWTGLYIGGNVGGAIGTSSWTDLYASNGSCCSFGGVSGAAGSGNTNGILGGAQLGFNYQTGWVVWGVEGAFDFSGMKGRTELNLAYIGLDNATKTNYISTLTGRIGGVFRDDILFYLKGGAAFIQNKYDISVSSFGISAGSYSTLTDDRTGWTLGFGTEYRFDPHWSARIEYDYLEFGSKSLSFSNGSAGCCSNTPAFSVDVPVAVHEFTLGVNYKIW